MSDVLVIGGGFAGVWAAAAAARVRDPAGRADLSVTLVAPPRCSSQDRRCCTVELSGAEGKERKRLINQKWIYPPVDDAHEILRAADPRVSRR